MDKESIAKLPGFNPYNTYKARNMVGWTLG